MMIRRSFLTKCLAGVASLLGLKSATGKGFKPIAVPAIRKYGENWPELPIVGKKPCDIYRWQYGLWEPVEYEQLRVGDLIHLCEDDGCVTRVVTEANPHFVAFSRKLAPGNRNS